MTALPPGVTRDASLPGNVTLDNRRAIDVFVESPPGVAVAS